MTISVLHGCLYWFVCYRLKDDKDFKRTINDSQNNFIIIKDVKIAQKYNVILVAVDGNNSRESDIKEIETTYTGIHNYCFFSKFFPSIFEKKCCLIFFRRTQIEAVNRRYLHIHIFFFIKQDYLIFCNLFLKKQI